MSEEPTSIQAYRPSASVIIAVKARNGTKEDNYNYKLLLFQRSVQTQYMPNHYVFPGGAFETGADESAAWLQHFRNFGVTEAKLQQLVLDQNTVKRPHPLLTSGKNFARDISLRIAAIRETFEEMGILLCLDRKTFAQRRPQTLAGHYYEHDNFDRAYWQEKVHNDAFQFLRLCQTLDVVPDLWSLYEWSVWRTPATASRKFDTVYYFVALETEPNLLLERHEAQLAKWYTPVSILKIFNEGLLFLPFILYYELSRLTNVCDWNELLQFASKRSIKGCTLLMPVFYRCDGALVAILPGDDAYPSDPMAITDSIEITAPVLDFRNRTLRVHRVEFRDVHDLYIALSIPPVDEHLCPLRIQSVSGKL